MSVSFKDQGFPGWFQDDPNKPTILRANVAIITSKSGGTSPIVAEFNYSNGSIQYYEVRGGVGFDGPRVPLFTQSASGVKTVQNQGNLNELKPEDISRIESSVKDIAFKANQKLATDNEKEDLKNSQYYKSQGNSATPGAGQGQSDPPTAPEETSETGEVSANPLDNEQRNELKKGISVKGVRSSYDEMRYPLNLNLNDNSQKQDVIHFKMYSYGTREFGFPKFGERNLTAIPGSVTMAIQPRISDSNTVTWNDSTMNLIDMGLANASLNFIENGFKGTSETIDQIKGLTQGGEKTNLSSALKIYAAQQAASTQNLLSRLTGGILNPNLELLFENPDLRIFNYSFQLSPREPSEAIAVKKIIRFFKQGMAVQRSEAELFLKAPNVFEIKYLLSEEQGRDHPYLNRIKRCALTNCGVDYTPTGSYMTFAGKENSMVSYNLSLTFKELEPIYADEYDDKDTEIGF
jgi:hypothetical protein